MSYTKDTIQSRLKFVIEELKRRRIIHNQSDFADILNKQASYISECVTGKRTISEKFIHEVIEKFPVVNSEFLFEGKGEPVLEFDFKNNIFGDDNNNNNNTTIHFGEYSSDQYIKTLLNTINHLTQQNTHAQEALKTTQELLKRSQEQIDRLLEILSTNPLQIKKIK